jgi:hypothetical protein
MSGDEILHLRMDHALKKRVKDAAAARHESLTTFVENALEKALAKGRRADKPSLQKALERAASEAAKGGAMGYLDLGRAVGAMLGRLVVGRGRREKLERLSLDLVSGNESAVFAWFEQELPGLAELVPPRRQELFVMGVTAFDDERGIAPWMKRPSFRQGLPGGER